MKKTVSGIMLTLLLTSMLTLAFTHIQTANAEYGTICINADGSITPPTAPISTIDNITYTFTGSIYDSSGIDVYRSNILINGNGCILESARSSSGYC